MHQPYTLIQRKRKSGKSVYYVRFRGQDGERLAWKSTGQTSKAAARRWADEYLRQGLVPGNDKITLRHLTERVWSWDSDYVKNLRAKGRQIGQSYVSIQRSNMENHVLPALGDKPVGKLTRADVERWQIEKLEEGKLSARTINHALSALKVALNYAEDARMIAESPAAKVTKLAERPQERGVLTPEEAREVLKPERWNSRGLWLFNALAAVTGARMGELQALRVGAIHRDHIDIREAWERRYGFKEPKWGSRRRVPIGPQTHSALLDWIAELEDQSTQALVFPGSKNGRPVAPKTISRALYAAMDRAGIKEKQRGNRRLGFHSWRHFATTQLRKAGVNDAQTKAITGHKTASMLDLYGQHFRPEDFSEAVRVLETGIPQ